MTALADPPTWIYIAIACAVGSALLVVWARHMERSKRKRRTSCDMPRSGAQIPMPPVRAPAQQRCPECGLRHTLDRLVTPIAGSEIECGYREPGPRPKVVPAGHGKREHRPKPIVKPPHRPGGTA